MSREELRKLAEDLALGPEALRVTRDDASHRRIRMEEDRIGAVDCGDCGAELAPPSATRQYLPWSVFARGQGVLIQHERTGRIIHACGEFAEAVNWSSEYVQFGRALDRLVRALFSPIEALLNRLAKWVPPRLR